MSYTVYVVNVNGASDRNGKLHPNDANFDKKLFMELSDDIYPSEYEFFKALNEGAIDLNTCYFYKEETNPIADAKAVLENAGYISLYFTEEDIKEAHPHLTEEQVKDIASKLMNIDCNVGINWESINNLVWDFYPED